MSEKWKNYSAVLFNTLVSNIDHWNYEEYRRPISRIFYTAVFDSGIPNPTGLISENAWLRKVSGNGRVTNDHCLAPQYICNMVMENPEKYLHDYSIFERLFFDGCATIVVTPEENIALSNINDGDDFIPIHLRYNHLGIDLRRRVGARWKDAVSIPTNILTIREDYIDFEKEYINKERSLL